MTEIIPFRRRLTQTPLRDLVRGRITGRLDWRGRLARAALPGEAKDVIGRVVDRTRLWKIEKAAVAGELTAHFIDGLDAGVDIATLVGDFGDERTAARLIRRSKTRGRSPIWKAWRLAGWFAWALAGVAVLIAVRFYLTHPTVSVDYVAQLNRPVERTADADRAWPLFRRAVIALGRAPAGRDDTLYAKLPPRNDQDDVDREVIDATPADAAWPQLTRWLDAHASGLALAREAAAKPVLGFVFGAGGSVNDPQLYSVRVPDTSPTAGSLISLLLPYLNEQRTVTNLLDADARYAVAQGDGGRSAADVAAMLGLARQTRGPFVVCDLVGLGIDAVAFERVARTLRDTPQVWTEGQLVGLAHRIALVGGDTPASLVDIDAERLSFHDVIQRTYTDDGHGDGHLTADGMRALAMFGGIASVMQGRERVGLIDMLEFAAEQGGVIAVSSRKDVLAEYDRSADLMHGFFARPLRESATGGADVEYARRITRIKSDVALRVKYWPIGLLAPSLRGLAEAAERTLGRRDGLTIALALEVFRRRHGEYPTTLAALVPELLPCIPADRIDGGPVKYRLIDGRPVVYSVGVDRKDDGGRAAMMEQPHVVPAARNTSPTAAGAMARGG